MHIATEKTDFLLHSKKKTQLSLGGDENGGYAKKGRVNGVGLLLTSGGAYMSLIYEKVTSQESE